MKKLLSLVLTAALMLCLCSAALAAPVQGAVLDGHYYAGGDNTGLLRSYADSDHLYDVSGNPVIDKSGAYADAYMTAVILTSNDTGFSGLWDINGKELLPAAYDKVELHDDWAVGYKLIDAPDQTSRDYDFTARGADGQWNLRKIIDTVDVVNIRTGLLAATLTRSEFAVWTAWEGYINIQDRSGVIHSYDSSFAPIAAGTDDVCHFAYARTELTAVYNSDCGKYAVADSKGNALTEAIYDNWGGYTAQIDLIQVENESGQCGLVDAAGREVAPMAYSGFMLVESNRQSTGGNSGEARYETTGVYCAYTEKSVVLINGTSGESVEIACDPSYANFYGDVLEIRGDADRYYTTAGTQIAFPEGAEIYFRYTTCGSFFIAETDTEVSVMDAAGNVLLSAKEADVDITGDGHVTVYDKETNKTTIWAIH